MNKYLRNIHKKGSANELDDLLANRNSLLAQGKAGDAMLLDAKIAQLKADGMKPTQSACFSADSQVLTPKGYQNISSLRQGSKVVSVLKDGTRTIETVKALKIYKSAVLYNYDLDNGTQIRATSHHTVLTPSGWKKLSYLGKGDTILLSTGNQTQPVKILKFSTPKISKVYNLHTTGPHNFIVNGVIAHNFTFARRIRSLVHNIAELLPIIEYDLNLDRI